MKYVDNFLNGITMYKLVLYGLFILAFLSIAFGFTGILSYSGLSFVCSFLIVVMVAYLSNSLIAKLLKIETNIESSSITGLILFLVLNPVTSWEGAAMSAIAAALASASKYIFVIQKKHIFNPVAISIFLVGLFGSGIATWWVGSEVMFIPVAILGFLVLRKVQRFTMFFSFLFTAIISLWLSGLVQSFAPIDLFEEIFASWPILFFGSIMLTEPFTTPVAHRLQIVYGILVGAIFGMQFGVGPLYSTPEFALIVGNIFSYIVSPRVRVKLSLLKKEKLTEDTYDFLWKPEKKFAFDSGQYVEWTLGHEKPDARGNRRYFTIASSPTEENILLGTKFSPKSSTFKQKLLSLPLGAEVTISELSGGFILPKDKDKKLVFIAGGIGITPFRSMIKELIDKEGKRDIFLIFSNRTPRDIVYDDVFDTAEVAIGLRVLYAVNELQGEDLETNMIEGFVDRNIIREQIPDFKDRYFYISGPRGMVRTFERMLRGMGIKRSRIKKDFFPGFV